MKIKDIYFKVPRLVRICMITLVVIYFCVVVLVYIFQSHLVYFPTRDVSVKPDVYNMAFEDLTLKTSDGVMISAWFVPAKKHKRVILFCHGNAGNMSHRLGSILRFHQLGYSVLIFDYRGYGLSEGSPTEEGTYLDAQAAWDYLVNSRRISPGRIVILGRSLGGGVASKLSLDNKPGAAIFESTFTNLPDLASGIYPILPISMICRFSYNTLERIAKLDCPVLVVHSRDDKLIPFSHGEDLFKTASEPKQFIKLKGGHNTSYEASDEVYTKGLQMFLSSLTAEKK